VTTEETLIKRIREITELLYGVHGEDIHPSGQINMIWRVLELYKASNK
jgi:hypothetical protein